jgi:hypothetical protein
MCATGMAPLLLNSSEVCYVNGKPKCSRKRLNIGKLKYMAGGEIVERGIALSV